MNTLKVGIIGTGRISQRHIAGYQACNDVKLYAFCDIDKAHAQELAAKHGVAYVFSDYRELLKLQEIDAVSVCTANRFHAEISIAALEAGKHVLCEKPMALNAAEAEAMKKAAENANKLLMVGLVRRYGMDAKILKDFIDAGDLGNIYYAKASCVRRNGNPGGWYSNKALSGGGPLIDLGIHVIDLVRYLAGNPTPVSVYGATFNPLGSRDDLKIPRSRYAADYKPGGNNNVEDMAAAMVRFDNGMVLNMEVSFSLNVDKDKNSIELYGTKAGAKIDPELTISTQQNGYLVDLLPAHKTVMSSDERVAKEIRHFVDCVQGKATCATQAQEGVDVMKILDAIYLSAETRQEVQIS